jgi:hypothetical protein
MSVNIRVKTKQGNSYTYAPVATTEDPGLVKPDNETIKIDQENISLNEKYRDAITNISAKKDANGI